MTPERPSRPRYRCRYCGFDFPAALPVTQEPDSAMLLNHLGQDHPDQVGQYLARIHTDADHNRVVVEAYELDDHREVRS
jgi:hypothetical protein